MGLVLMDEAVKFLERRPKFVCLFDVLTSPRLDVIYHRLHRVIPAPGRGTVKNSVGKILLEIA